MSAETLPQIPSDETNTGKRRQRKVLSDDSMPWESADNQLEINRIKFLEEIKMHKIKSDKYAKDMCKRMGGHDVSVAHFQKEGFTNPIFVPDKDGLGKKISRTINTYLVIVSSRQFSISPSTYILFHRAAVP